MAAVAKSISLPSARAGKSLYRIIHPVREKQRGRYNRRKPSPTVGGLYPTCEKRSSTRFADGIAGRRPSQITRHRWGGYRATGGWWQKRVPCPRLRGHVRPGNRRSPYMPTQAWAWHPSVVLLRSTAGPAKLLPQVFHEPNASLYFPGKLGVSRVNRTAPLSTAICLIMPSCCRPASGRGSLGYFGGNIRKVVDILTGHDKIRAFLSSPMGVTPEAAFFNPNRYPERVGGFFVGSPGQFPGA